MKANKASEDTILKTYSRLFLKTLKYILMIIICFEIALRIVGYQPYDYKEYAFESVPNSPFVADDSLGIRLADGLFQMTLNKKLHFSAMHKDGMRITPKVSISDTSRSIHFYGCSFTYGYGVNDAETFCTLIQNELGCSVLNKGVIGYGTVQSYMQLKILEKSGEAFPETCALIFSSVHFGRNVLSLSYRKNLKLGFEKSSARMKKNMKNANFPFVDDYSRLHISYEKWEDMYSNYSGRTYFSSVNWLQNTVENLAYKKGKDLTVTVALLEEMLTICKNNNSSFKVFCLDTDMKTSALSILSKCHGIEWVDINFDFSDHSITNYPYDNHPSKKGHQFIAEKILLAL